MIRQLGIFLYLDKTPVGEVLMDADGYYKYWPSSRPGHLDQDFLLAVGNFLREKNKDWDALVQREAGNGANPQ